MSKQLSVLFVFALLLGFAVDGRTAPLNYSGTAVVYLYDGDEPNVYFYGGGVATVNGTSGVIPDHMDTIRLAAPRGFIGGSHTHFVTDPEVAGSGLAAIQFHEIQGMTGDIGGSFPTPVPPAPLPVHGIAHVCLLSSACTTYISLALTQPVTLNGEPGSGVKGIGVGGLLTMGGYGGIRFSIQAAPWTIKTATGVNRIVTEDGHEVYSTFTMTGWAHGPMSASSTTAQPGGGIQLISPVKVESNVPMGFGNPAGSVGNLMGTIIGLHIRFIPEPGLLLLLGSGVAGLALLGRRRFRR